jgi:hypothetical protein
MSAEHRTQVTVAWIAVAGAVVTTLGGIAVAVLGRDTPVHIQPAPGPTPGNGGLAPVPVPSPSVPSSPDTNISGTWRDEVGTVYEITQAGNRYTYTSFLSRPEGDSFVTLETTGSGRIVDGQLNGRIDTTLVDDKGRIQSTGTLEGELTVDGRRIIGTMVDYRGSPLRFVMTRQ